MCTSGELRVSKVKTEKWTKACFDNAKITKKFRREARFKIIRFSENCLTNQIINDRNISERLVVLQLSPKLVIPY